MVGDRRRAQCTSRKIRRRAFETMIAAYWRPVYKYVRLRWNKDVEEARDLTQIFFFRLLEKDFLAAFDQRQARLRTFLRMCVDRLVANEDKARSDRSAAEARILKLLDFEAAEGELRHLDIPSPETVEDFFEREWARSVFSLSVERLKDECEERGKQKHFDLFEFYDIEEEDKQLTYAQVAERLGVKATDVTNYLAYVRREFRRIVLEQLREMTGSEEEFQREARTLLGMKQA